MRLMDLTGKTFGRLTVISRAPSRGPTTYWHCKCSCGNTREVASQSLRLEAARSCGCLRKELLTARNTSHGMKGSYIYGIWKGMIQRCTNSARSHYKRYGGRGIKVCKRWEKFENFYADVGDRPTSSHTLDRIDNDGDYTLENCRWATPKEQKRNTSRTVYVFDVPTGDIIPLPEFAERHSLDYSKAHYATQHLRVKA